MAKFSVAEGYAETVGARPFAWSAGDTQPTAISLAEAHKVPTGIRVVTPTTKSQEKVGIIGAGMGGLYAGLLLKENGIPFHIFEGNKHRVGGRVYTCREGFGGGKYQYFEAGAMRIPQIDSQQPIFDLIEYLNRSDSETGSTKPHLKLIDYHYKCVTGNLVYVNGKLMTLKKATESPQELCFDGLRPEDAKVPADTHMDTVMKPLLKEYEDCKDDKARAQFMKKYDHMSLRYYLGSYDSGPKWYPAKINYVETMTSGTNAFTYGLIESVIEYQDFNTADTKWHTIDEGMSRLPEACAAVIGEQNISMGAIVYKIAEHADGKIELTYSTDGQIPSNSPKTEIFDKVLVAVSNAVLRMIERPRWSSTKEEAIRACNMQPCYKLGLQFNTRFWEYADANQLQAPAYGGQSTTDTPSRWIVYPSYDLRGKDKGILLTYSWSTDALSILPASDIEKKEIALRDLQKLYPTVNIQHEFTGNYKSVHWSSEWGTGVADFLPGQFGHLYQYLEQNEGNIYFTGEHISLRHGWIVGALDSAGCACKQMFKNVEFTILK